MATQPTRQPNHGKQGYGLPYSKHEASTLPRRSTLHLSSKRMGSAGLPDSPVVFAALTAEALDKAVSQTAHMLGEARGPLPPEQGGAYMDDTYLWSHDKKHLQATLTALEAQLAQHGLAINPKKTAIVYSDDAGKFHIGGATVACLPTAVQSQSWGPP